MQTKEQISEYNRQYRLKNKEKLAQKQKQKLIDDARYAKNRSDYGKQYYADNTDYFTNSRNSRRRFLIAVKWTAGCMDCGYSIHPEAMDFDHRPGEIKSFTLNQVGGRTFDSIIQEVMKCDVVCANCHRIRTSNRREGVDFDGLWLPKS